MPEYNVSKLKLPNGVILNLPGGSNYDKLDTSEIDGVNYNYMSQDAMIVSPQDLAYLISYVSGNMLGDPLPDNANLNNYAGFDYEFRSYYTDNADNTISNVPINISTNVALTRKFKLICSHINTGNYMQVIIPTDVVDNSVLSNPPLTSLFYIRFKISSTWTSWKEIGNFWWLTKIESLQWGSDIHQVQNQGRQLTISLLPETNGSPVENTEGVAQIFYIPFGDSSSSGLVRTNSQAVITAPSSSSSTTSHTVPTQLGLYRSLHDTGNALTLQNISAGTDDTTAYTITASGLAYAVQAHDHLVEFSPLYDSQYVYDDTNKELRLNADIVYSHRDSTGHPGGIDLDITSTGYLEIPYGNGTNPGILKLSSAAATSSSASGNNDYTAATPKAVYDSIHSTSNVMPSATATAGTDTTTGYTLTAARLKEVIETFGGTNYDAIDESTDFWGISYDSLSTDEKVISPKMLADFIEHASGRTPSYRLPSNANLNDYIDYCHTYFCDTNSSNMTNLPTDVSCDGVGKGYFNLIPINIGIFSKGQILIAEDKDYIYFRRYRQGAWTAWRALGIPSTGSNALGNVYLTDSAATSSSSALAVQSTAASPRCVYNSIRSSDNAASTSDYGVTKLSTSTSSTSTSLAATPLAVKSAYDLANNAYTAATTAASTSTAGRVQLSSSTSSTSTTLAATPSAVRSAYNLADRAYDLADSKADKATTFSMNISTSISASDYQYSAVVSNGIVTINFRIQFSSAPASDNYLKLFTGIPSSYRPPQGVPGSAMTNSCATKTIWVSSGGNILGALSDNGISAGGWLIGSLSYSYDSNNWVD